jgi:hypothetical protein
MTQAAADDVLTEPKTASADTAREEYADVLEQRSPHAQPQASATGSEANGKSKMKASDPYHRFSVGVWITNFNSVEFGLFKRSRNRAKSLHFTSDMDIFAEIQENGQRTGLLGYREDLWTKQNGFAKRLVFKLFSEKLNWHASMDMMLGRSVQQTIGARGIPVTTFSINTYDHWQIVYLERSAAKWPLLPESFSFFLLEEGGFKFYRLKQDLFSIGMDYSLYDGADKRIGVIDGKVFSLGGKWDVKVLAEHCDKRLLAVLKLFIGMLVFNKSSRKHVAHLAHEIKTGRVAPKAEKEEADLYRNPRRMR